ncbi:MAG: hypothetical protein HRU15_00255 [Planctomycetes bacterium]|nr:hypothetical protein [Planctomycetota bacterium]
MTVKSIFTLKSLLLMIVAFVLATILYFFISTANDHLFGDYLFKIIVTAMIVWNGVEIAYNTERKFYIYLLFIWILPAIALIYFGFIENIELENILLPAITFISLMIMMPTLKKEHDLKRAKESESTTEKNDD